MTKRRQSQGMTKGKRKAKGGGDKDCKRFPIALELIYDWFVQQEGVI